PKKITQEKPSFFKRWWNGTPSDKTYVPILHYWFKDSLLFAIHYIDEGLADTMKWPISTLLPKEKKQLPISEAEKYIQTQNIKQQTYLLGTDRYGRDILSRLIVGTRVSIAVGIIAVILSLTIGISLG